MKFYSKFKQLSYQSESKILKEQQHTTRKEKQTEGTTMLRYAA